MNLTAVQAIEYFNILRKCKQSTSIETFDVFPRDR